MSKYNYLFKVVIIGDHNVGKSCLLLRFVDGRFRDDHITTIGVDFKLKTVLLDRDRIRLELWDTAGMERYRTIYNSYYHAAHGVICVYDITDRRSYENLRNYWVNEVKRNAPQNTVLMLVGNKCDLSARRHVDFDSVEQYAADLGVSLFEVSAHTGINVDEAFMELVSAMRERVLLSKSCLFYENGILSAADDSDEVSSGFHIDGVIGKSSKDNASASCCAMTRSNGYGTAL